MGFPNNVNNYKTKKYVFHKNPLFTTLLQHIDLQYLFV